MKLTVQVTLDGRVLVMQGRNIIELPLTQDTEAALALLNEARTEQAAINGDAQHD